MIVLIALSAHYASPENTKISGATAAIVFIFVFVTCYATYVDASSFVYCSKIFPTQIRAQEVGFSISELYLMDADKLIKIFSLFSFFDRVSSLCILT